MEISKELIYRYKESLCKYRFIIVQHLMNDTFKFVTALIDCGVEIVSLFAKEYSLDIDALDKLKTNVTVKVLYKNSKTECTNVLNQALELSKKDNKDIVILDLGGEYASILEECTAKDVKIIAVEDTAFGHRKYQNSSIKTENIHIFSVAESRFKEIEAKFVGNSIVSTAESVFRTIGKTLIGSKALVVGYGMIGKNVALSLKAQSCKVAVFDTDKIKLCHAFYDGFEIGDINTLSKEFNVIFGVTGNTSVTAENVFSGAYLISGSSKQVEFSQDIFSDMEEKQLSQYVTEFSKNDKKIYLFNQGFPVNFISNSVPDSVIDFVFSEMIACILEEPQMNEFKKINAAKGNILNEIADIFVKKEVEKN